MAADLDYVAMPEAVAKQVRENWKAHVKDASGKAIW
jgi:phosphate transport system substrate-binding protein